MHWISHELNACAGYNSNLIKTDLDRRLPNLFPLPIKARKYENQQNNKEYQAPDCCADDEDESRLGNTFVVIISQSTKHGGRGY